MECYMLYHEEYGFMPYASSGIPDLVKERLKKNNPNIEFNDLLENGWDVKKVEIKLCQ